MTDDNLIWLLNWYYGQCDGDWEHSNGIKIGTIDNPGWFFKLNLSETDLVNKKFQVIDIARSENDWLYCSKKNEMIEGFCGPLNLPEILKIFRNWVET